MANHAERSIKRFGNLLSEIFHYIALFVIGSAIVWSAVHAFFEMVQNGVISVEDILLLFVYLELGAMVGIYFRTSRLPVRFFIYIAITVLTRMLIDVVQSDHTPRLEIIYVPAAILILTFAVLCIRFTSYKYPNAVITSERSDD